jgi:hypothetical protein
MKLRKLCDRHIIENIFLNLSNPILPHFAPLFRLRKALSHKAIVSSMWLGVTTIVTKESSQKKKSQYIHCALFSNLLLYLQLLPQFFCT